MQRSQQAAACLVVTTAAAAAAAAATLKILLALRGMVLLAPLPAQALQVVGRGQVVAALQASLQQQAMQFHQVVEV
jgi:hypothetical protein